MPHHMLKLKLTQMHRLRGFAMAELIIAISVLSFGVVLVYGSFYNISTVTYSIAPRFTASYLAQEGLDIVRNIRDNNFINARTWSVGIVGSPCDTGCQMDYKTQTSSQFAPYNDNAFLGLNSDGFYSYDVGATPTVFRRKVTITPVTGTNDTLHVESLVTWTYKGQLLSFKIDDYLYNWY